MHITVSHADKTVMTFSCQYFLVFIRQKSCILFSFIRVACKKFHGKTVHTNARCKGEEWCVYAVWEGVRRLAGSGSVWSWDAACCSVCQRFVCVTSCMATDQGKEQTQEKEDSHS